MAGPEDVSEAAAYKELTVDGAAFVPETAMHWT